MRTRFILLLFVALHLALVLLLRTPFLTDWDSYLYTYGGLHFEPVGLAGGRWFYTALLGTVWTVAHTFINVPADSAWKIFSGVSVVFAIVNVILFYRLAQSWLEKPVAIVATFLFIASPLVALYGSPVMTESPALTALIGCLLMLSHPNASMARIIAAGVFFGLGIAIREPLALLALLPLGLIAGTNPIRRIPRIAIFVLGVAAMLGLNFLAVHLTASNWEQISHDWSMGMTRERMTMSGWLPKMLGINILCLICWLIIFGPAVFLLFPEQVRVFRKTKEAWVMPLLAGVLIYCLGQIANHSLIFNPRFVIFPGVLLCIPAALGLWNKIPDRFRNPWLIGGTLASLHLVALSLFWPVLQEHYFDKSLAAKETYQTLAQVPDRALMIPGRLTPVVDFYKKVHHTQWHIIYAGWDFSDKEMFREIESSRQIGRPVFLVEPGYWSEARSRPDQHNALQTVWNQYLHQPSVIPHFYRLLLSDQKTPEQLFRRIFNFLLS